MKRIISFLLALTVLLSLCPLRTLAAETALDRQNFTVAADPGLPDNEELFASYTRQLFSKEPAFPVYNAAGPRLSGDVKVIYDALTPILREIAEGKRSDTTISIGRTINFLGEIYVPDVEAVFTGSSFTGADLRQLLTALLTDLPYALYWYDKTTGCSTEIFSGSTLLYVNLKFTVAENYRSDVYAADTGKTAAAANAAANAKYIVRCYADTPDYNKLMGYADAICDLANYNHAAASKGSYAKDNDPWQLIHVFDGDPNTNVVCEGYAKAYLYLCELSSFRGNVSCHTVTGTMNGDAHMWNLVTLEGKNYLVDVTNTDDSSPTNAFLLAGCTGTLDRGYQVARTSYRYDSATTSFWGTDSRSILNISRKAYSPSWALDHNHSFGSWNRFCSATPSRIGVKSRTCSHCGYMDTYCSSTKDLDAPSLTLSANTDTGKPKLRWNAVTGADAYRVYRATSKTGTYKRIKSTTSTGYTDTSAAVGKKYYYKVVALDTATGKTSKYSNILNRVCDLPKPSASLSVNTTTGKIVVKWETVEGAVKYYIYRATGDGSFSHIKTAVSARSFEDTTAKAGINYSYKVKAVHSESAANSAYCDTMNRVCDLPKPVVSIKLNSAGAPYMTWKEVSGAKGYEIFRSESKSGTYTSIGTTTSLRYADRTAEASTEYFYKVKALHKKSAANSAYSSVKYITAK